MKITRLAPSRAHRWWNCLGSVRMEATAPITERDSEIAREGTAAHKLFELCLSKKHDADRYVGEVLKLGRDGEWEVTEEMAEHIQDGVDVVRRRVGKGKLWLENEVHIKANGIVVGGTLDASWHGLYQQEGKVKKALWELNILDLKYGLLMVEAHDNKQLRIYARGKLRELLHQGKKVDKVVLWIYQPRLQTADDIPFRRVEMEPHELIEFEMELQEKVEQILKPKAPLKAGTWCLYCAAHATCPEAERAATRILRTTYSVDDRQRIGELMIAVPMIEKWCGSIRELAKSMGHNGGPPIGFKMVPGNRLKRWPGKKVDAIQKTLPKLLKAFPKVKVDDIAPRALLSPSKVLKVVGKDQDEKLSKFYFERRGADRLVPENDSRSAMTINDYFEKEEE